MSHYYVLDDDNRPRQVDDVIAWAKWFETAKRIVAQDSLDTVSVSTVFLGVNHQWAVGPPILWETMVFGGPHDGYQERYATHAAALAGHAAAVVMVKAEQ